MIRLNKLFAIEPELSPRELRITQASSSRHQTCQESEVRKISADLLAELQEQEMLKISPRS
jgi:hypothetical protein